MRWFFLGFVIPLISFTSLSVEDYKVIVKKLAAKYKRNVNIHFIIFLGQVCRGLCVHDVVNLYSKNENIYYTAYYESKGKSNGGVS